MKPEINIRLNKAIRRKLFEKPVNVKQAKRYILNHGMAVTRTVYNCFKIARSFTDQADEFVLCLKRGIETRRIFNDMIADRRNSNYWLWVAVYIAKIENAYKVDMYKDAGRIAVNNKDQDLTDLTEHMFSVNHRVNEDMDVGYQSDSYYNLDTNYPQVR